MVDRSSLWPKVSEHAERLLRLLEERRFEGFPRDAAVLSMYWRTRRLYEAALHLLKAHLPEEAGILGRSLFETAMRLMQLAAAPGRQGCPHHWLGRGLNQQKGGPDSYCQISRPGLRPQ
jgi:hypothetical protein